MLQSRHQKGEVMLTLDEFIRLLLNASDDVKATIEQTLEEAQSQTEHREKPFCTSHTVR